MGDAVFCAAPYFHNAQNVIVIWGDQVNVSIPTLTEIKEVHGGREKTVVLPTVATPYPYVEYIFTDGRLTDILESREGALCKPNGFNDVGTFILSVNGLNKAWEQYTKIAATGTRTGELNFLPFILYLSKIGWDVIQIIIEDVQESRGVNTHEDLLFAADKFTITSN
jgi:bifunctional N-acetylglucosamine-1-phosphate-uridyltransferase/glucosamine-1-phosphate-acetyltransferase GlmU-like protein